MLRRIGSLIPILMVALVIIWATPGYGQVLYEEHFTDGQTQLEWQPLFGRYYISPATDTMQVIQDPTTPEGDGWIGMVAREDSCPCGMAWAGHSDLADYSIEAWVYVTVDPSESYGLHHGLCGRIDTTGFWGKYYMFMANFDETHQRLRLGYHFGEMMPIVLREWTGDEIPGGVPTESGWHKMKLSMTSNELYAYWNGQLLPDCPITHNELTHGSFGIYVFRMWMTEGVETKVDNVMIMATSGYVLNLDSFPMYEAEGPNYNEMCGAAVAKMALDYMYWDNTVSDTVLHLYDQSWLYTYGINHNSGPGDFFDLVGMWHTIQDNRPLPYSEYGYNFTKRHSTDQYKMLKRICLWIDYPAGRKEHYPVHVPAVVPAYGDYTNWMAIRGIHTDVEAYPMPDTLIIYGFWVNDPYPQSMGGIGENSYKIIGTWNSDYYNAMITGDYTGEYLGIFEPPESVEGCELILATSIPRFSEHQMNYISEMSDQDVILGDIRTWIIQAAINGVTEQLIPYDENFKEVFETTQPGDPFFVTSIKGDDYYTVPFNIPARIGKKQSNKRLSNAEQAMVVILIDANDGSFKEASWTDDVVEYLPISKAEAQQMTADAAQGLGLAIYDIDDIQPELIHRKSTPYYPQWRTIIKDYAIYISQDGTVSIDEWGFGPGGPMSQNEGTSFTYALKAAAPSPFVNHTTITYSIAKSGNVSLNIYDVTGRLVKTLVNQKMDAGVYNLTWNGYDNSNQKLAHGVYFTKLSSGNFVSVKKLILVR